MSDKPKHGWVVQEVDPDEPSKPHTVCPYPYGSRDTAQVFAEMYQKVHPRAQLEIVRI